MKKTKEARIYENEYCPIYDTWYEKSGEWIEQKCADKECVYCFHRPVKHSKHCSCLKENADSKVKKIPKSTPEFPIPVCKDYFNHID